MWVLVKIKGMSLLEYVFSIVVVWNIYGCKMGFGWVLFIFIEKDVFRFLGFFYWEFVEWDWWFMVGGVEESWVGLVIFFGYLVGYFF